MYGLDINSPFNSMTNPPISFGEISKMDEIN